jgi:hypothetical protein
MSLGDLYTHFQNGLSILLHLNQAFQQKGMFV